MKTTKIFSVLSLALIFATVTTVFAGNNGKNDGQVAPNTLIRYHVNINLSLDFPLCNLWMVKIIDGNGVEVAPAKAYNTGVSQYEFFERGPAEGTRIAVLVRYQYGDHFQCVPEFFVQPAFLSGKFLNGQTYRFDLYPTTLDPKE
jgi:hypothetical protein